MPTSLRLTTLVLLLAAFVLALPAHAQPPADGPGGGGGMNGPGMGGRGMGPMGLPPGMTPQVTMLVSDGVIYLACDGKLTAYEAKTLKQLAQVTFATAPQRPGGGMGPGGGQGQQPAGPPPAAP